MSGTPFEFSYAGGKHSISLPPLARLSVAAEGGTRPEFSYDNFRDRVAKAATQSLLHAERMLFVINDAYRLTPTPLLLDWLARYSAEHSLSAIESRADILVATGTHEKQSEKQLREILGHWYDKFSGRISSHDCRDEASLRSVGNDSFGQPVKVNRALFEYPAVIVIGSVEPHYFAGLTGGRKGIIPGLADFASVERNHNLANDLSAAPLRLQGNPVAEHLDAMLTLCPTEHVFSVQAVLDQQDRLIDCTVGDIRESFTAAVSTARAVYEYLLDEPVDLIVAQIRPPLNRNLYQAQKGLENCQQGVRDRGVIVVIAECDEGVGSAHFFELAKQWNSVTNTPADGKLHFGSHKLSRVVSLGRRLGVNLLSTLPVETVSQVFYRPLRSIVTFDALIQELGRSRDSLNILFVPNAGHTVVRVKS